MKNQEIKEACAAARPGGLSEKKKTLINFNFGPGDQGDGAVINFNFGITDAAPNVTSRLLDSYMDGQNIDHGD